MKMSHKFVVIDEIMAQLESAKSGLIPSSVKQSIVSGIQNVPTAIKQPTVNGASGAAYTTFPLSPIIDNCCIDKTYLNLEFDVSFHVKAAGVDANDEIPFFIGFRDTASLFNQIQFLIEGSVIWQTVYQREESVLAYNSLPETEVRGNNQYASIDKLRNNTYCPMKRVVLKFDKDGEVANGKNITIHFKVTVDINRLSPIFSNLHFTTPHMGNLRLKVYLQEFAKCLFFCPDYGYSSSWKQAADAVTLTPDMVQYWQFYSFNGWFNQEIGNTKIPFFAYKSGDNPAIKQIDSIKFENPEGGLDFMTFANGIAEIVQTNFAIKEEEYKRLNDYFAGLGSVIMPTNVWSTNVFNNSIITDGKIPTSMIGNVSGYNIDSISVWFHPTQSPCSFSKEFLTNTQLLLEGRPVNPIPYANYGDKFVTDMTQALVDTDCEEINKDYMSSITLFNFDGQHFYDEQADYKKPYELYGRGKTSINCSYLANPNSFCFNFSTNLPDAFHSGACILENTNKQSVIRFISSDAGLNVFDTSDEGNNMLKFPVITNSKTSDSITAGFSCLCDACIVLSYDAARGTCFGGQLSWAAPYM